MFDKFYENVVDVVKKESFFIRNIFIVSVILNLCNLLFFEMTFIYPKWIFTDHEFNWLFLFLSTVIASVSFLFKIKNRYIAKYFLLFTFPVFYLLSFLLCSIAGYAETAIAFSIIAFLIVWFFDLFTTKFLRRLFVVLFFVVIVALALSLLGNGFD